jgi:hypothetical protein
MHADTASHISSLIDEELEPLITPSVRDQPVVVVRRALGEVPVVAQARRPAPARRSRVGLLAFVLSGTVLLALACLALYQ